MKNVIQIYILSIKWSIGGDNSPPGHKTFAMSKLTSHSGLVLDFSQIFLYSQSTVPHIFWTQATMPIKSHFSGTLKCNKYICVRASLLSHCMCVCSIVCHWSVSKIFHARLSADIVHPTPTSSLPQTTARVVVLLRMLQKLRVDVASAISKAFRGNQSQASSGCNSSTASRKTKLCTGQRKRGRERGECNAV